MNESQLNDRKKIVVKDMQSSTKKMKLKIGKLASLLGVSAESIRYYEKMGIIGSFRTENNTRYYDAYSRLKLLFAKQLQASGCTMREATDYYMADLARKEEIYTEMEQKALAQAQKYMNIAHALRKSREGISKCHQLPGKTEMVTSPGMIFFPLYGSTDTIGGDQEAVRLWADALPVSRIGFCLRDQYDQDEFSPFHRDWGMLIEQKACQELELPQSDMLTVIPEGPCIRCYISDGGSFLMEQVWNMMEKVSQTYRIVHPPFGFLTDISLSDKNRIFLAELWIPVEDKNRGLLD